MNCRTILSLAALAALTPLMSWAQPSVGEKAPDFTLKNLKGEDVTLSDHKGKFVVLEWTNPGCPFVQKFYEAGEMQRLQQDAKDRDVVWLTINSTSPKSGDYRDAEAAKKWSTEQKMVSPWLEDASGKVGKAYGAQRTPEMVVINPEGVIVYRGAIDSIRSADQKDIPKANNYVSAALDQAMAGKPVADAETRPYGCSVKY